MSNKPIMLGAMKRGKPGGFAKTSEFKRGLGFGYAGVKKAADLAVQRLLNRGGLR